MFDKKWQVTFFNENVENDILKLPKGIVADLLHIFELVEQVGPNLGRPHSAPLGDGLFEFRARGKEGIARSIFCMMKKQEVVILHTVVKKTNTLPKKDFNLAKKRKKELDNEK